ncbi:hypothetical protein [Klebsiella pneumoniae]|uniref:hypothetical protein n=1 Tax=Klebsiella pneumoniae TaxID=573 RepID=UPI000F17630C|nr:hypothetical protein [Klebsiella pneumoniae]VDB02846.1 hypothetical protein BANRA_05778 [Klebsiella pneumoniae]
MNISSLITACRKLYDVDYSKWGRYIDDLLIAENRSLIQNAWAMHQEGLIDEAEVIEVAGYMDYLALKGQVWTLTNGVMPAGH